MFTQRSIINKTPLVCLDAIEHGPAKQVLTFIKLPDTTWSGNEYIFSRTASLISGLSGSFPDTWQPYVRPRTRISRRLLGLRA